MHIGAGNEWHAEVRDFDNVTRFEDEEPLFASLYEQFLEYAAEAHTAMTVPRFGQDGVAPGIFDAEQFVRLLGIDTTHQWHPVRQHWIVKELLERDLSDMPPRLREQLVLANLFHDSGEPFSPDGDVRFGLPKNEEEEARARCNVLLSAFGMGIGSKIIALIEPVLMDPTHELSSPFNLVEKIGYYQTADRFAQLYLGGLNGSANKSQMASIGDRIVQMHGDHSEWLSAYRHEFTTVNLLLHRSLGKISVAASMHSGEPTANTF